MIDETRKRVVHLKQSACFDLEVETMDGVVWVRQTGEVDDNIVEVARCQIRPLISALIAAEDHLEKEGAE